MQTFTLALYDVESANDPFPDGKRLDDDEVTYAVGVVRYVTFWRRADGQVGRATRLENVHFSPVALLDDLFRPWVHAVAAYNGRHFDNPVVVANAVAKLPAVYVQAPEGWGDDLPPRALEMGIGLQSAGLSPTVRVLHDRGRADAEADAFRAWVSRNRAHSRMIPPGTVGLVAPRPAVLDALNARTFDPLRELAEITGHPHVAKLDYFREGMTMQPFTIDGAEVSGAEVPELWRQGRVWDVVAKCRHDVGVLEELLHHAFFGGPGKARLQTPKLNRTWTDGDGNRQEAFLEAFLAPNADNGAVNRYRIPTRDWWDRVAAIAATSR